MTGVQTCALPIWSNFATDLEHKRQEFSASDLIGSLDVEEKTRAKDTRARVAEAGSSAHVVHKKNFQQFHQPKHNKGKSKGKGKSDDRHKPKQPTNFKKNNNKPRKGSCHVCGDPGH